MIRKIFIGAMFLVAISAAPAAAQYPPTVVTPTEVLPGGAVSVSGQGCDAGIEVDIYLVAGGEDPPPAPAPGATPVATTTTDEDGNFTVTFNVPTDTEPGVYTVVSSCGSVVRGESITILSPTVTTSPNNTGGTGAGTGSGNLPRTGSNLDGVGLVGAGLVTAGGLAMLATRKRRTTASLAA